MRARTRAPAPVPGPILSDPVTVAALGAEGDGIASVADGTRLFLAGTLPGELVQPVAMARRGDAWTADATILEPSLHRIEPPCRHFGPCGGCVAQHMDGETYAAWKLERLATVVRRLGFDRSLHTLERTPPGGRRRMDFAIRRENGAVRIGLHMRRSGTVVDVQECPVLHPTLFAAMQALRPVLRRLQGLRREGSAVLNLLDAGPDLLLRTDAPLSAADRSLLAAVAIQAGMPRIAIATGARGEVEPACTLRPSLHRFPGQVAGGLGTAMPPGAFMQASAEGEASIGDAVLASLPALRPRAAVVELFAGVGTLTHRLAGVARVRAYEGDRDAAAALKAAGNPRIEVVCRDLARQPLGAAELTGVTAVVLDPPWSGAREQMPALATSGRPVIYVSCNPAALLRDGQVLRAAGYGVTGVTAIDQFLWSAQVEAVVAFARP